MNDILVKLLPVILIFALGYFLKCIKVFKKEDADLFLKVVFYIASPALIILSITKIILQLNFILLPVSAALIVFFTSALSFWIGKLLKLQKTTFGTFIVGTTIMNLGFISPFIIAAYGQEGLARLSLFDFANGLLSFTFVYFIACKFSPKNDGRKTIIKKFIASPPIWALFIAIILNFAKIEIPIIVDTYLQQLGNLTVPLIMLSLGIYFNPKFVKNISVFSAVFIRMLIGLIFGFILVKLFNFQGLNRSIVLIASAAPVGYNTLTFSSLENLDKEFAVSIVSCSILIGIILIPVLIFFLV